MYVPTGFGVIVVTASRHCVHYYHWQAEHGYQQHQQIVAALRLGRVVSEPGRTVKGMKDTRIGSRHFGEATNTYGVELDKIE